MAVRVVDLRRLADGSRLISAALNVAGGMAAGEHDATLEVSGADQSTTTFTGTAVLAEGGWSGTFEAADASGNTASGSFTCAAAPVETTTTGRHRHRRRGPRHHRPADRRLTATGSSPIAASGRCRLVGGDGVGVGQRDADVVEAAEEAVLGRRVHREWLGQPDRRDLDDEPLDVDGDLRRRVVVDRRPDALDHGLRHDDRARGRSWRSCCGRCPRSSVPRRRRSRTAGSPTRRARATTRRRTPGRRR